MKNSRTNLRLYNVTLRFMNYEKNVKNTPAENQKIRQKKISSLLSWVLETSFGDLQQPKADTAAGPLLWSAFDLSLRRGPLLPPLSLTTSK